MLTAALVLLALLPQFLTHEPDAASTAFTGGFLGRFLGVFLGMFRCIGLCLAALVLDLLIGDVLAPGRAGARLAIGAVLVLGVGLAQCWCLARYYGPPSLGRRRVLIRGAYVAGGLAAGLGGALAAGVPLTGQDNQAGFVVMFASACIVGAWRLADRIRLSGRLAAAAAAYGTLAATIAARTAADHPASWRTPLVTGSLTACAVIAASSAGTAALRYRALWTRGLPAPRGDLVGVWPPVPGEVWYVFMPYRDRTDGTGKKRPVVVLDVRDADADVLEITSQDKDHLPHLYQRLSSAEWGHVLAKQSWLSLRYTAALKEHFDSYQGPTTERTWTSLTHRRADGRLQRDPSCPGPATGAQRARLLRRLIWGGPALDWSPLDHSERPGPSDPRSLARLT